MEILVSLSALQLSQYRQYAKGWKPDPQLLEIFEKQSHKRGKKAFRIYFDYATDKDIRISDAQIPSQITAFLQQNGYQLLDYAAGTVKDKHERVTRLGKVLSKQPDLKKLFDNDANRRQIVTASKGNKLVCLSMHPYDVAGMSTDRGWTSCMNLVSGSNKQYVKADVEANTLIAYLINEDDKNINAPIMRVLLKKYFATSGDSYRYIAEVVYPDAKDKMFLTKVQEWVDENINTQSDRTRTTTVMRKSAQVYNDDNSDYIFTNLGQLGDKTLAQVEKILDGILAKLPRARTNNFNPASIGKLFKTSPQAILAKNISRFSMQVGKIWAKSIQSKPNKLELVSKVFAELASRQNSSLPDRVLGGLVAERDFDSLRVAGEYIDLPEFILSGALDSVIGKLYNDPAKPQAVFDVASNLAQLTNIPDETFWRVLSQTTDLETLEDIEDQSRRDNMYASYVPAFKAISEIQSPFTTLKSLKKAKETIPRHVTEIFKFFLSKKDKNLIEFTLKDYGISGYKDRYRSWDVIDEALEEMENPPVLKVATISAPSDTPIYLGFDVPVSKEEILSLVQKAIEDPSNGETYTETIPYKNCRVINDGKDLLLVDRRGREHGTLTEALEEDDISVEFTIYEDEKTHIPMVRYEGEEEEVENAIDSVRYYVT